MRAGVSSAGRVKDAPPPPPPPPPPLPLVHSVVLPSRPPLMSLHVSEHVALPSRVSKGVAGPPCLTRARESCHKKLYLPQTDPPLSVPSMNLTPALDSAIKAVVRNAVPNVTVQAVQPSLICGLPRGFHVSVSDERTFLLSLSPSLMLRLLRSEQWLVRSECLLVDWIFQEILDASPTSSTRPCSDSSVDPCRQADIPPPPVNSVYAFPPPEAPRDALLHYLPALIADSASSKELGSPFNLWEPTRGCPVLELSTSLTVAEREAIDFQAGCLVRIISQYKAPGHRFGPVIAVIGGPSKHGNASTAPSLTGLGGFDDWPTAFQALVEGILRDGEDMSVMLSYSLIRNHLKRLSHVLDYVTESRLVALDAASDANVLVVRSVPCTGSCEVEEARKSFVAEGKGREKANGTTKVEVTGLRDWSNCIFGDPLMTTAFSCDPSRAFLRGFCQPSTSSSTSLPEPQVSQSSDSATPPPTQKQPTKDEPGKYEGDDATVTQETAPIRLLLYECYHAALGVIKQFYRPDVDSTKQEMAARRRLAAALNKLEQVDESVGKRPRRGSTEAWPVKRAKSDGGLAGTE